MQTLIKTAVVLLVLIASPFILAALMKQSYEVERSIVVNKPVPEVFNHVRFMHNQDIYHPWITLDTNIVKINVGVDGRDGYEYSWSSRNPDVGSGSLIITRIIEDEILEFEMSFSWPKESLDRYFITTTDAGDNKTRVAWGYKGEIKFPKNLMLLFVDIDSVFHDELTSKLATFKEVIELD